MSLLCDSPPKRPAPLRLISISELFADFERIFLSGDAKIYSRCEHVVLFFDHHFFHLADVGSGLFMYNEKEAIRSTTDGFGKYEPAQNGSRARHLNSAKATIEAPDEVWEGNPKSRGRWVYLKEFDDSPYPFSVAIITNRDDGTIVPKTSFPCRRSDINGWRRGVRIYPKTAQPPG